MNYRNRKLLDLAHSVEECMNCLRYSPGCEPAHQNGIDSGKGHAMKAHDNRHAALCHDCHAWLDQGTGLDPSGKYGAEYGGDLLGLLRLQKREMWERAHMRTYDYYWRQGWLKVAR